MLQKLILIFLSAFQVATSAEIIEPYNVQRSLSDNLDISLETATTLKTVARIENKKDAELVIETFKIYAAKLSPQSIAERFALSFFAGSVLQAEMSSNKFLDIIYRSDLSPLKKSLQETAQKWLQAQRKELKQEEVTTFYSLIDQLLDLSHRTPEIAKAKLANLRKHLPINSLSACLLACGLCENTSKLEKAVALFEKLHDKLLLNKKEKDAFAFLTLSVKNSPEAENMLILMNSAPEEISLTLDTLTPEEREAKTKELAELKDLKVEDISKGVWYKFITSHLILLESVEKYFQEIKGAETLKACGIN